MFNKPKAGGQSGKAPHLTLADMPLAAYTSLMSVGRDKELAFLHGEIKSPPFSERTRLQAGFLLRRIQEGDAIEPPTSKPMPSIGPRCHELRLTDNKVEWRIFYRIDDDAILILGVHKKKTQKTPPQVIKDCRDRLRDYDAADKPKPK
jgi:phage-related protein